jgi:hypothetical protein
VVREAGSNHPCDSSYGWIVPYPQDMSRTICI